MPPTVLTSLRDALRRDPGRPLVTFYDGATGERIELSLVTFTNWVDKIANLLADELMLDPGQVVHVELPTHWQSCVTVVGAWTAGLRVSLGAPPEDVALSVVGPDARTEPSRAVGQVLACSLRPMGGAFTEALPSGWLDFAREVPPRPDALIAEVAVRTDDVALVVPTAQATHAALVEQASPVRRTDRSRGGRPPRHRCESESAERPDGFAARSHRDGRQRRARHQLRCGSASRDRDQERVTGCFWLTG